MGLRWGEVDEAFLAEGDKAIEFMIVGLQTMPPEWEKRVPKLPKIRSKSPKPSISVSNKHGSVLDIEAKVVIDGADDLISFRDLLRWLHDGRRWVTLADGSVAKLDPQILNAVAEAAGAIDFDKHGHAEISTLELGTLSRLLGAVPTASIAREVKKLMSNMTGKRSSRGPRKAKALNAKLRPYQRSGFAWLWQLHINNMTGILADDMGLGKTVQALALLTQGLDRRHRGAGGVGGLRGEYALDLKAVAEGGANAERLRAGPRDARHCGAGAAGHRLAGLAGRPPRFHRRSRRDLEASSPQREDAAQARGDGSQPHAPE